jgi:hypothetical protein
MLRFRILIFNFDLELLKEVQNSIALHAQMAREVARHKAAAMMILSSSAIQ